MPNPRTFLVEFELPSGASVPDAIDYIESALQSECGFRDPKSDPMFNFKRESVKVRIARPRQGEAANGRS